MEKHTIAPVFDRNSKILILGSFPSVKSREREFFYGHPQNRFWRVLSSVIGCECPKSIDGKKRMLLANRIALWDVIESCDITGSADSSIRNVTPNNLSKITDKANIGKIFTNGGAAFRMFQRYNPTLDAVKLPSTSPANASFSLERLVNEWKIIRDFT